MRQLLISIALFAFAAVPGSAVAGVADEAVRKEIAGIDVIILRTNVKDVVTLAGSLPAGDERSPRENVAIATLTGSMLDKGTTKQDKFAIAQQLGDAGAGLSFGVDSSSLQISGKSLRKDLPMVLSLLAEQLRTPAFTEDEFGKLKKLLAGAVRRQQEDTDARAEEAFSRAIYPEGHPNRQPSAEELLAAIDKASIEEVRRFHSQFYGPTGMRLVLVGDVDPAAAQAEIRKVFSGWRGGLPRPETAKAGPVAGEREVVVFMPDKTNVSVLWGQPTQLTYSHPDTIPLRIGSRILGSGGFMSRLMATIRDREGLTYGIASYVSNDTFTDGDFRIWANFAPELLDKGLASTRREVLAWRDKGITQAELERTKTEFTGTFKVGLSTTSGMAGTILVMLNRGMPLSFVDEYPKRIAAMTRDEVNGAIKRHIDPAKLVLVQAGTIEGAGASKK